MVSKYSSSILAPFLFLATIQQVWAGCCSQNYKDCDASWCGNTQNSCESCGDGSYTFLQNGALGNTCLARWSSCTNNQNGCCGGLDCVFQSEYYSQCLPSTNAGGDSSSSGSSSSSSDDNNDSKCGCDSCTEQVQYTLAGQYSCGARIDWLQSNDGFSETKACETVAGEEFPEICGPCNPQTCNRGPCEDNPNAFGYKGKVTSCQDIAALGPQKRSRKCREGRRLFRECPAVCDAECATPSPTITPTIPRGDCENNPDPFEFKGKTTSCAEIASLGPQKENRKCREGRRIAEECPEVCKESCSS